MGTNIKILVVEDSEIQREICVFQLNDLGFENVAGAVNGDEAYAWLEKNPVDLIICDLDMPELDGLELLKKVKANPSLQNIPFIVLTVIDDENKNRELMNHGATDYIVKPSTPEVLKEMLGEIFPG